MTDARKWAYAGKSRNAASQRSTGKQREQRRAEAEEQIKAINRRDTRGN